MGMGAEKACALHHTASEKDEIHFIIKDISPTEVFQRPAKNAHRTGATSNQVRLIETPPSTIIAEPVVKLDASDAR